MWTFIRHLVAIIALPVLVVIIIPVRLAHRYGVTFHAPATVYDASSQIIGFALLIVGLTLFTASLYQFVTLGRGTLAPWDPPRHLVVSGPYRFVRNPMISGVIFMLFGIAVIPQSLPHALWAAAFLLLNLIYIPLVEEPRLMKRFGDEYRRYRNHVPRFFPRVRPWHDVMGN
jgi:protein-S-isoprenylcysteine O-methyltransferase Ste14